MPFEIFYHGEFEEAWEHPNVVTYTSIDGEQILYSHDRSDANLVEHYKIIELQDENWVELSQSKLPVVRAGRYMIYARHHEKPLINWYSMHIEASAAFGTGQHETTVGCLQALHDLSKYFKYKSVLDIGSGTGVLAMAALKTKPCTALATDIDPVSVDIIRQNARLNQCQLDAITADGYNHKKIKEKYDLIFANILCNPLCKMANDCSKHLKGYAILSGLLTTQKQKVIRNHINHGMQYVRHYDIGDWSTVVMK